jgi:hypothetical protein
VKVLGRCRKACRRSLPWIGSPTSAGGDRRLRGRHGGVRRHERAVAHVRAPHAHAVDPNQEMVGLGAANLAAGCSRAFRSAAAPRARRCRSAGREDAATGRGRRVAVALLLLLAPNLLQKLPSSALARS